MGQLQGDALVGAEPGVELGEAVAERGLHRVDDPGPGGGSCGGASGAVRRGVLGGVQAELQAEVGGPLADRRRIAEEGEVADVAAEEHLGGAEHPLLGALRQHDVLEVDPVAPGLLQQLVLEHHRGDPVRAAQLDAVGQLGAVHVHLEEAEGGLHLARGGGGEPALQGGEPGGGGERAVRDDRDRRPGGQPGGEPHDVLARMLPQRHQHPGERRGAGGVRGEGADQQVGAVAGGDHHRALGEGGEEVRQHGAAEDEPADVPGQPGGVAEQHFGAGGGDHLGDRRGGERGLLGQDVERDAEGGQAAADLLLVASGHPVGDRGEDRAAQVVEGADGAADLGDDRVGGGAVAAHHGQHPGAELVGEAGVEGQLVRDAGVGEVGAEDEERLAAALGLVEAVDEERDQLFEALLDLDPGGLGVGHAVGGAGRLQPVAGAEEVEDVVPGGLRGVRGLVDQRAEHADRVDLAGQQLHDAEFHGLAAVATGDTGHVHTARHGGCSDSGLLGGRRCRREASLAHAASL